MTLDDDQINYILSVAKTAKTLGVGGFVIEPGFIRGVDEKNTRILLHTEGVQPMPFGTIGINRIDTFIERLEIAQSIKGFSVEVSTRGEDPTAMVQYKAAPGEKKKDVDVMFVSSLLFKAKGLKLDFKCSHPMILKSPRSLNDKMRYRIKMTPDVVHFLSKGKSAFKATEARFIFEKDALSLEMSDDNNDKLTYEIETEVERVLDEGAPNFAKDYPLEILLPFLKSNPDSDIYVSDRVNYIRMEVNNFTVIVLPKQE